MNLYYLLVLQHRRKKAKQNKLDKLRDRVKKAEAKLEEIDSSVQFIEKLCIEKGMSKKGLYPCKKCGGEPTFDQWSDHNNEGHCSIKCSKCDRYVSYEGSDESGVDDWNLENKVDGEREEKQEI